MTPHYLQASAYESVGERGRAFKQLQDALSLEPQNPATLGVIGDLGDQSDLPKLREMARKRETVESRGRGFGFMPAIDLGRAAQNAADKISAAEPRTGR